ncbi:Uncharacterized protein dnm_100310 [Desulfonema magnum]|uniref:Uncharacterized protein n=1 Tax=Desulfonema magnum TaxID=45655 RepID=A0A975BYD8_9BACT|nr:Uncharacterized protein dnm_100310 [Desulfonema magnum]
MGKGFDIIPPGFENLISCNIPAFILSVGKPVIRTGIKN